MPSTANGLKHMAATARLAGFADSGGFRYYTPNFANRSFAVNNDYGRNISLKRTVYKGTTRPAAEAGFLICALYAALKRRSFTVSQGAARSSREIKISSSREIKIRVKGSGQECPLTRARVDAAGVGFVPFAISFPHRACGTGRTP
jgi:hypothetical protein